MSTRCKACNAELSDADMLRKNPVSGEFEDLCNRCRVTTAIQTDEELDYAVEQESREMMDILSNYYSNQGFSLDDGSF